MQFIYLNRIASELLQWLCDNFRVECWVSGDQALSAETSLSECYLRQLIQVLHINSRGHSLTKTEILHSAALSQVHTVHFGHDLPV